MAWCNLAAPWSHDELERVTFPEGRIIMDKPVRMPGILPQECWDSPSEALLQSTDMEVASEAGAATQAQISEQPQLLPRSRRCSPVIDL